MTWLYLNDTVLQKRNTFFVINSTAEIRQDTLSYTLTLIFQGELFKLRFCTPAIPSFRSIISSIKKSAHRHNGDEREFLFTSHNSEHLPIQFLFSFSSAGKLLLLSPC